MFDRLTVIEFETYAQYVIPRTAIPSIIVHLSLFHAGMTTNIHSVSLLIMVALTYARIMIHQMSVIRKRLFLRRSDRIGRMVWGNSESKRQGSLLCGHGIGKGELRVSSNRVQKVHWNRCWGFPAGQRVPGHVVAPIQPSDCRPGRTSIYCIQVFLVNDKKKRIHLGRKKWRRFLGRPASGECIR